MTDNKSNMPETVESSAPQVVSPSRRPRSKSGTRSGRDFPESIPMRLQATAVTKKPSQHEGDPKKNNVPSAPSVAGEASSARPLEFRRHRPRGHENDPDFGHGRPVILYDIIQSKWIQDPDNHSLEKVYLTLEDAPLEEMSTIDTSFCWIHHKRDTESLTFEDLERILHESPGLYDHEIATASKCLEDVKTMRRVFAKGKYFEPIVHQVKDAVEVAGQKTPVKATFVSIPIFSLMSCQESPSKKEHNLGFLSRPLQTLFEKVHRLVHEEDYDRSHHHHLATHVLQNRNTHPIRSLMQYSNILAIDNSRDYRQAIIRLEDETDEHKPFIHVPEFWALIINMYTVITCAPFSVEQLCADNIIMREPPAKDRRVIVKYTSLGGTLHDFRCRTWVGLLNIISRIESNVDELSVQVGQEKSEYRLIDAKFRTIDRKQWLILTAPDTVASRSVSVRLIKMTKASKMTVLYSERKFWTDCGLTWSSVWLSLELDRLRAELNEGRTKHPAPKNLAGLEMECENIRSRIKTNNKLRIRNRLLLCAVRYHLIDPLGVLWLEDESYLETIRQRKDFGRTDSVLTNNLRETTTKTNAVTEQDSRKGSTTELDTSNSAGKLPAVSVQPPSEDPSGQGEGRSQETDDHGSETMKQVIERLRDPQKKGALGLSPSTLQRNQRIATSPVTFDEVNNRFKPPKRIFSTQTTLPHQPPKLQRAITFQSPDIDLEAQRPTAARQVKFTAPTEYHGKGPRFPMQQKAGDSVLSLRDSGQASHLEDQPSLPYIFKRRVSQVSETSHGVLAAPPQRLPLSTGEIEPPPQHISKAQAASPSRTQHGLAIGFSPQHIPEGGSSPREGRARDTHNAKSQSAASALTAMRKERDLKSLQPFFEWHNIPTTPTTPRGSRLDQSSPLSNDGDEPENSEAHVNGAAYHPNGVKDARVTLETLDLLMCGESVRYLVSEDFPIKPEDYCKITEKSLNDVIENLDAENRKLSISRRSYSEPSEALVFWETKLKITLRVDGLLRCFISADKYNEKLIKKVWGIVFAITDLSLDQVKKVVAEGNHGKLFSWTEKVLDKIEQLCREILMSARSDTGKTTEQLDLSLPPPFTSLFRDIVLFLLSTLLTAGNVKMYEPAVDVLHKSIQDVLVESETALLRTAIGVKDKEDIGDESIRTADTLLGLLLQNAFSLSCSEPREDEPGHPRCDLEHIYRRYTAVCHERAIREASAEMYEEVRLLREELGVIVNIFEDQQRIFHKAQQLRESPKQNLDNRLNRRVEAHLEDMIKHFRALRDYAEEAETLTTNYIRVSNEDNSKAIYVFTTVTVIFLPLSFVSGVFGMNTADIRSTNRTQWLFWVIAVPVTIAVLILCLILVKLKFKFKLRRRFGSMALSLFPKSFRERMSLSARDTRTLPRYRG